MAIIVFSIISLLNLVAVVFLAEYLKSLSQKSYSIARAIVILGLVAHWSVIFLELAESSSFLNLNAYLSALLFSAIANSCFSILLIKKKFISIVAIGLPFCSLLVVLVLLLGDSFSVFNLPSVWLWTHIFLMLFGEALFFFAALAGIVYLISAKALHGRVEFTWLRASAPLPSIDEFVGKLVWFGWILLSCGIILGTIFAREFWSSQWWLDAKVLFALATCLFYGLFLCVRRLRPSLRGRRSAWIVILIFAFVFIASIGIDILFDTQHDSLKGGSQKSELWISEVIKS